MYSSLLWSKSVTGEKCTGAANIRHAVHRLCDVGEEPGLLPLAESDSSRFKYMKRGSPLNIRSPDKAQRSVMKSFKRRSKNFFTSSWKNLHKHRKVQNEIKKAGIAPFLSPNLIQDPSSRGMLIHGENVVEDGIPLQSDSQAPFTHLSGSLVFGAIRTNGPTHCPE